MSRTVRGRRNPALAAVVVLLLLIVPVTVAPAITHAYPATGSPTADSDSDRNRPSPTFTLNRIRLYVIHARRGEPRVLLAPLNGHHPKAVVSETTGDALRAIDLVRRELLKRDYSDYSDLEVVSQNHYLLQAVRTKGGQYSYRLSPEPGLDSYSSDSFDSSLEAQTTDGQLSVVLNVTRNREDFLSIGMQMNPGRSFIIGHPLDESDAIFAVLTIDTPESSPYLKEMGSSNPRRARSRASAGETPEGDIDHTPYLVWDTPPRLIHYSRPAYPDIAQRAGVEGHVTFHVVIGPDGRVEQVDVADQSPQRIFERAAREAIMKWRYTPATVAGKPVRALFSQTVQFVLSQDGWSHYR